MAIAAGAHWWELSPAPGGRWALLLDASPWGDLRNARVLPYEDVLTVPVGRHPDGAALWDLRAAPHLLVTGATGSGKSSFLRAVVATLPYGWCWRVVIIDPKELDFRPARHVVEVAGLADASDVLLDLGGDLARRKAMLASDGCDHWNDLPQRLVPVRPVLLVIDEAADVLGGVGRPRNEAQEVRDHFGLLVRQGRACGIHVVASFTRPDTDVVPGALRDQFGARVGLGPLSADGARMVFGNVRVPALPEALPGTGLALGLDGSLRLRRLGVPLTGLDAVVRRHGLQA